MDSVQAKLIALSTRAISLEKLKNGGDQHGAEAFEISVALARKKTRPHTRLEPQDKDGAKWLASMSKTDSLFVCGSINFDELCCCVGTF